MPAHGVVERAQLRLDRDAAVSGTVADAAQIAVERAIYGDAVATIFAAGSSAVGTRLR